MHGRKKEVCPISFSYVEYEKDMGCKMPYLNEVQWVFLTGRLLKTNFFNDDGKNFVEVGFPRKRKGKGKEKDAEMNRAKQNPNQKLIY